MVAVVWAGAYVLRPAPLRHLVLATGLADGLAHRYAQRYIEILARSGVRVEERMTSDLRVSVEAVQHKKFGPNFLRRYLPFWVATMAERAIIIVVPLAALLVPLFHYLPQILRWRVRSRIYRWYGELAMLERDVATRGGALLIEKGMVDLDRIEHAVTGIRTPSGFASEAYTLREHIALVRRAVVARMSGPEVSG